MARTENRKRGAAPRNTGGGGGKRWPLFAGGVATGLVVAGGIYLAGILPTAMAVREQARAHEEECAAQAGKAGRPEAGAATTAGTDGKKPVTFEFYSMLPQQEVVAPVAATRTTTATPPPAPPVPPAPTPTVASTPPTAATATPASGNYLLQAGSFRTRQEADRRRGELLLSGQSVSVKEGKTADGATWYRVMVGPFGNEADMQKARQQLAASKVETLPIRVK